MKKLVSIVASAVLACASFACSVETSSSGTEPAEATAVRERGAETVIAFGTDSAVVSTDAGARSVAYYRDGEWVGTIQYASATRHLAIRTPRGFEREGTLPFDLASGGGDPAAVMAALGMTEEERDDYLGDLAATDARLASANVGRALAAHRRSSGLEPRMWGVCTNETEAIACGLLTLGLCGYAMILDCL